MTDLENLRSLIPSDARKYNSGIYISEPTSDEETETQIFELSLFLYEREIISLGKLQEAARIAGVSEHGLRAIISYLRIKQVHDVVLPWESQCL